MSKWVYITGCDSGFGALAIPMLNEKGLKVFAGCYLDTNVEKLRSDKCFSLKLDVTKEASVLEAARVIKEHLEREGGQLVGLVNNAGILVQPCPTEWQTIKDFRDMFEVNVFGTVLVTQSVLPLICRSKGRIVCVASIAGKIGLPTEAAYCASKHAVEGYASVLRKDMYPWGVTVHIIEPGIFKNTGLYGRFQTGLDHAWERLSPEIRADYGEAHKNYVRALLGQALNELGTSDSTHVPKAYVHALTADTPLPVYRVGWDSKYLIPFLNMLHETTSDAILLFSDGRIPVAPPSSAPKDGALIARSRYDKGWPKFIAMLIVVAYVVHRMRR